MIKCPLIDPPANGRFQYSPETRYGSILGVDCDEGYFLTGDNNVECVDKDNDGIGEWHKTLPTCTGSYMLKILILAIHQQKNGACYWIL